MAGRVKIAYDAELSIEQFGSQLENSLPTGTKVSRNLKKNSLSVSEGPFVTASIRIRHREKQQESELSWSARQSLGGGGRSLAIGTLGIAVRVATGIFLLPLFLVYQTFFVGSKVTDLDQAMEHYVRTRMKELGISELP